MKNNGETPEFPAEAKIGEIRRSLAANRPVVLVAPPGSGKTTCVPPALLGEPWLLGKKIVMLEPRRIAARSCASWMAKRRGEAVGGTVGYQVRLERRISPSTRLEVLTEGLLSRRIMDDPELKDVGLVVFDEFHERSLQCDFSFALALEARRAFRPDLRLMVMSATLDSGEVARHLGDADVISAEGRMHPVETRYLGDVTMSAAISRALKETDGDMLCFLPGEGEIRRVAENFPGALQLYGSLPKERQDLVFRESAERKIILATSIAETSLTIPGISVVIDSGLMRIPRFSPSTGMSGLVTVPLSLDRAEQRRGRAGRTRAGTCYRLWNESGNAVRPGRMTPEILDADLAGLVLACAAWGAPRRGDLPWLTPPPASSWDQASGLLELLGALDSARRLTPRGEAMAKLPVHPRLANMILEGGDPLLAAIIEEGTKARETDIREIRPAPRVKELAKRFESMRERGFARGGGAGGSLSPGAALALAYPDRVARGRGNGAFRMVSGRGAFLDMSDPLAREPFLVLASLDDRLGDARVFHACPVREEEIVELFGEKISERRFCAWDRRTDRVVSSVRSTLGEMVLRERPCADSGGPDAAVEEALIDGVRLKGVANLPGWTEESLSLRERIAFLHRTLGGWPEANDEEILAQLPGFAAGISRWKDLGRVDMSRVLDAILAGAGRDRRELDRLAPARMEVPSGSRVQILYGGDEPTAEVRLQECFGLMDTPRVAGGRVPVVMTLLSPARRPVQVTKDLAGFWREGYRLVRKDLRGRYPKHYWPEDPMSATATRFVRPRIQGGS